MPKIFKPRRSKRATVKTGAKKSLVLQDGELMIVRKTEDSAITRGVKSDIYIGNGITQMQDMKPAVYGDTSEEPITVTPNASTTVNGALNSVVDGENVATMMGALKQAILLTSTAEVPEFTPPTSSRAGESGVVPAPAKNTMNYILTASGWKTNVGSVAYASSANYSTSAGSATRDANGNAISDYIKGISVSGATLTVTKGNGNASTYELKDEKGEYPLAVRSDKVWRTNTTSIVDNNNVVLHFGDYNNNQTTVGIPAYSTFTKTVHGLVPAPTTAKANYILSGNGWIEKVPKATSADSATNASNANFATNASSANFATSADSASSANYSTSAGKATNDSDNQPINKRYFNDVSITTATNGTSLTLNRPAGTTAKTVFIPGTTKVFTGATSSANGTTGLVPAPLKTQLDCVLYSDGSWKPVTTTAVADVANYISGLGNPNTNCLKDNTLMDFGVITQYRG